METDNLECAKRFLCKREGTNFKSIGYWPNTDPCANGKIIAEWAEAKGLQGVVWTALGPKFECENGFPSKEEAVEYLKGLKDPERKMSKEYICKAPEQIRTPYRQAIEEELGWLPNS